MACTPCSPAIHMESLGICSFAKPTATSAQRYRLCGIFCTRNGPFIKSFPRTRCKNFTPRWWKSREGFPRQDIIHQQGSHTQHYRHRTLIRPRSLPEHQLDIDNQEFVTPAAFWEVLRPSISYLSEGHSSQVKAALEVAFQAHQGQKRKSGEPYIVHPVEVARILGELEMDWETIAAGLLHDTVEDTDFVTFESIESQFGIVVRRIVEGETKVSKLGKLQCSNASSVIRDVKADDLRQMFLAMTEEVRVIIVKLADRLHNMRTLSFMPKHKQRHIALETLQVFAPLARLLGMYKIKAELEELSFMYAYPEEYNDVKHKVGNIFKDQEEMALQAKKILAQTIIKDQFLNYMISDVRILTFCKELYSIYKKMKETKCSVEDIGGIAQVRIILKLKSGAQHLCSIRQVCYHVLGLVHELWPPVPQMMKDYIATPKPNGYQSLHTKVIPFGSKTFSPLEVQIRTGEMDKLAEWGIAAHYSGKINRNVNLNELDALKQGSKLNINGKHSKTMNGVKSQQMQGSGNCLDGEGFARRVSWLNSIREWQEEFVGNMTSREFVDTITGDLLGSRVFIFTPKGEIKNLPKGATVIDYAYQIHSDVGNKMVAAKVNGNLVSPTHVLSNAEVVEILTYDGATSKKLFQRHQRWLQFAKTRSARHKLTKFLKEQGALSAVEITADVINKFVSDVEEPSVIHDDDNLLLDQSFPNFDNRSHLNNNTRTIGLGSAASKVFQFGGSIQPKRMNGTRSKQMTEKRINDLRDPKFFEASKLIYEEARPRIDAWLTERVISWRAIKDRPINWFSVSCLDRKNMLAEVAAALSGVGFLIHSCMAETESANRLGVMLFHIEGNDTNLVAVGRDHKTNSKVEDQYILNDGLPSLTQKSFSSAI